MALGIVQERWTLERVVEMTDEYLKGKEDADFEAAFANFTVRPKPSRVTEPTAKDKLLTPWYLDPESGGPNPTVKKADIQYDLHMTENE